MAGLYHGAVLFRQEALEQVGAFDEELLSEAYVIRDYCFRMIEGGWRLKVSSGSFCGACGGWSRKTEMRLRKGF